MPARPTGAPELRSGKWFARVTLDRKRRRVELSTCRPDDEPKASERAALLADLARRLRRAGHRDMVIGFLERAAGRDGAALEAVLEAADRHGEGRHGAGPYSSSFRRRYPEERPALPCVECGARTACLAEPVLCEDCLAYEGE